MDKRGVHKEQVASAVCILQAKVVVAVYLKLKQITEYVDRRERKERRKEEEGEQERLSTVSRM